MSLPMDAAALLPLVLVLPLLTAAAGRLPAPWSERAHLLGASALLAACLGLAGRVFGGGPLAAGDLLYADALSALLVAVIGLVGWGGAAYSVGYLRHDVAEGRLAANQGRWFVQWYQLFLLVMLATVLAENLGLMWAAVEATTLASAVLVGFYRTRAAMEAAWKYLLICTVGITFALFGVLLIYYSGVRAAGLEEGALSWRAMMAAAPRLDPALVRLAFIFVLVGFGTKAGFAPLHTWLPDAHSQAPTPVSAVLSGVLLPCALYAILRFHLIAVGTVGPAFSSDLLVLFGVLSAVVAVPFVLVQRDLKRLLAYSSMEHIGLIAAAVGIGGPLALFAAGLHLLGHAVGKALLFFAAGNVSQRYGTRAIGRISGAASVLPLSGAALLAGALALAGAPPSVLFTSELGLLAAGFAGGRGLSATLLLACLALVFAGLVYHAARMSLGRRPERVRRGEGRSDGLLIGLPLAALALLGVWLPPPLVEAIQQVAAVLGGA
jgi:hydrogenase-4 component F